MLLSLFFLIVYQPLFLSCFVFVAALSKSADGSVEENVLDYDMNESDPTEMVSTAVTEDDPLLSDPLSDRVVDKESFDGSNASQEDCQEDSAESTLTRRVSVVMVGDREFLLVSLQHWIADWNLH